MTTDVSNDIADPTMYVFEDATIVVVGRQRRVGELAGSRLMPGPRLHQLKMSLRQLAAFGD